MLEIICEQQPVHTFGPSNTILVDKFLQACVCQGKVTRAIKKAKIAVGTSLSAVSKLGVEGPFACYHFWVVLAFELISCCINDNAVLFQPGVRRVCLDAPTRNVLEHTQALVLQVRRQ